jgi:hypothetical protein
MSIKNGASVAAQFIPTAAVVDPKTGIPTTAYGRGLLSAFFGRTGLGTGIVPIVSPPLTAMGNVIGNALQLAADWNDVAIVAVGAGVAIAAQLNLQPGNDIWVCNRGANSVKVYPPSGATVIDALAAGAPFVLASGKLRCFQCWPTRFNSFGN